MANPTDLLIMRIVHAHYLRYSLYVPFSLFWLDGNIFTETGFAVYSLAKHLDLPGSPILINKVFVSHSTVRSTSQCAANLVYVASFLAMLNARQRQSESSASERPSFQAKRDMIALRFRLSTGLTHSNLYLDRCQAESFSTSCPQSQSDSSENVGSAV